MAINFKNDESFLRKLAVGAEGTKLAMAKLRSLGFAPIELERGSTGFKIWKKIKIKRVRMPDILCLRTGLRFESRGKTNQEISMSHSRKDESRRWDFGMRNDDTVVIIQLLQDPENPISLERISPIHFIKISEMQKACDEKTVKITEPKGVEEGSEIRIIWPSASASSCSKVVEITDKRISLQPFSGGRKQSIRLNQKTGKTEYNLHPQVEIGQEVERNQIVASVVSVDLSILKPEDVTPDYFVSKLKSPNVTERYSAAKALKYRWFEEASIPLRSRMEDKEDDVYVRLEAAAALAANGDDSGWLFMENNLTQSTMQVPLTTQLETVIVASEIDHLRSQRILVNILCDNERDSELRAGAAWGLGRFNSEDSAKALIETFNDNPVEIKQEAARALYKIGPPQVPYLLKSIKETEECRRDGIAWALSRIGNFNLTDALKESDENLSRWVAYIAGEGKENFSEQQLQELFDGEPKVYFAASVLWQVIDSWIHNLKEY